MAATANEPVTFRSVTAIIVWVIWLLFAVANWIDLAVQGRDHTALVAAAVLLLVTGIGYVTAQRPRVVADDTGITVRNPLRDHRIGWAAVAKVDLADLLRVHCEVVGGPQDGKKLKVISAWAVHYSRRRQLAAELKARRAARRGGSAFGMPAPFGGRAPHYASAGSARSAGYAAGTTAEEAEAERTVRLLSERATAHTATDSTEPLTSTWSWPAVAAVVIPALILLVVSLV